MIKIFGPCERTTNPEKMCVKVMQTVVSALKAVPKGFVKSTRKIENQRKNPDHSELL